MRREKARKNLDPPQITLGRAESIITIVDWGTCANEGYKDVSSGTSRMSRVGEERREGKRWNAGVA